ncbi:DUF309 domain-containing protein [Halobacteriovorax sp. HLS]|uniref:DUF309 domain-containing protein n=1 Tax=Halobacteriovorax sp. HLS TaxID=2234000 RepID=UPI000FD782CF|nr:DUF309 domain-containing protein [Halobacteriovorax sp. HLS]
MRYCPVRELPAYAFRPGQHTHPNKEGGHSFGNSEVHSSALSIENPDFLYAIDLFNHDYYWEAHVYLEAIWNFHKRVGPEAIFCKALIKICAAALKEEISADDESARGHFERAIELVNQLDESPIKNFSKVKILDLIKKRQNATKEVIKLETIS